MEGDDQILLRRALERVKVTNDRPSVFAHREAALKLGSDLKEAESDLANLSALPNMAARLEWASVGNTGAILLIGVIVSGFVVLILKRACA